MTALAPVSALAGQSLHPGARTAASKLPPTLPPSGLARVGCSAAHPMPFSRPALPRLSSLAGSLLNLGAWGALEGQKAAGEAPTRPQLASSASAAEGPLPQDVAAAAVLCEAIYRAVDHGHEKAEVAIRRLQQHVPAAPRLRAVQWSPPGQEQQYVVAETEDAILVAFLGTKRPGDHLVNLRLRHVRLFGEAGPHSLASGSWGVSAASLASLASSASCDSLSSLASSASSASFSDDDQAELDAAEELVAQAEEERVWRSAAAHSGYVKRAAAVPAEQLYQLARVQGKRLVMAGHSLGGAVATLCTVRLLDALPAALHPTVSCVAFAAPPVGNAALAAAASAAGWAARIFNYTLPEDWVPGLLGIFSPRQQSQAQQQQAQQQAQQQQQAAEAERSFRPASAPRGFPDPGPAHERVCWAHAHECVCWGHAHAPLQLQRRQQQRQPWAAAAAPAAGAAAAA